MPVNPSPSHRARDERGAVAIMVAASLTGLLVVTAMVLDFGLVRLDKQHAKSLTDSAATAGIAAADGGTGDIYTYRAVCGALSYLRSDPSLATLPDSICGPTSLLTKALVTCSSTASATHAVYDQTTTSGGVTYRVVIRSPYVLDAHGWSEEGVSNLAADQSTVGGCDQLGVEVFESRKPGLGSLATDGNLSFGVRSAARALLGGDDNLSPALILLERTACSVLTVGSAGGGSGTYIAVKGTGATPGSIHADSDATGSGCGSGSNQPLFQGKQNDGIVAYGSTTPTGTAGLVTSFATNQGAVAGTIYDSVDYVYGTPSTSGTGATKTPVQARKQVTRSVVDVRYRTPVRSAVAAASGVWGNSAGWTVAGCNPTVAQLALTTKLWIDCTNNSGITLTDKTIAASEIYFNGFVKNGSIAMPNATRVYVSNTAAGGGTINSSAITLGNGNGFCVRSTCGTTALERCSSLATSGRARVFVRQGNIDTSGGTLRMCNTTAFLLGGNTVTGCVPASDGAAPTSAPCTTTPTAGNSVISTAGQTTFDWTAPNEHAGFIPEASKATAWGNFEDLALWSESAGLYKFSGGGGMNTVGVFMVPNGSPVSVGGGSSQSLVNAQYVVRTFSVSGGGTLELATDPRNAVTIPTILGNVLIR